MLNKVKYAGWSVAAASLAAPMAAFAQWPQGLQNAREAGTPTGTITGIVETTMNFLLGIVGFLGIIGFAIAGILYLTAAGDEKRIETAKKAMIYSILGVVVALIGFVVIQAVTSWLGVRTTQF